MALGLLSVRKRPRVIRGVQLTEQNAIAVADWLTEQGKAPSRVHKTHDGGVDAVDFPAAERTTGRAFPTELHRVEVGDWILQDPDTPKDIYPCKERMFEDNFEILRDAE